ncbi:MAG: small multi-drug export protein, partial [Spirochaetes bacterium]|nr:small multi-drug export protein [Spirochaetota bacterium]
RWKFYRSVFDRFVLRAREKVGGKVEKYGYWGIFVFVALPLPFTGAWTGTLGGWVLGMRPARVMAAVALGVLAAGIIVSLVIYFGVGALSFLIKRF